MNKLVRLAIGFAAAFSLALLLPTASFANPRVSAKSNCSGSGNFSITLGFNSSTNLPTVSPASNVTCVGGGGTVSFDASGLPSGMTWTATFPSQSVGGSLFTSSCTFGTSANSTCTVASGPSSGDYFYSVSVTNANGTYTLDPKVIISGIGQPKPKHHKNPASPATAAPPPQQ
ncbi:MAG TPA: hypothetical protein VG860_15445 [Terriglobia bacterium]|jgi:hypothetical protein|nr:hypothetical protein [Terriglobia bacterium]